MTENRAGDLFQEQTKYERHRIPGRRLDWATKPETYKSYPAAARVQLSPPQTTGGASLWDVLAGRRSERRFRGKTISESEVSQLLWAAQGITHRWESYAFRTSPSAGALYPVETYLVVHSVEGILPGVYHYAVREHELEQLRIGDFRAAVARSALDQGIAGRASVVFVWSAVFARSKWKYGQRAYRYVYLDAGHIAQNVALAAVALGMGSCQIAALYDGEANDLLQIDGAEESTIYMTAVGKAGA
jgi:SagB-type dehydrogenase family enzyme